MKLHLDFRRCHIILLTSHIHRCPGCFIPTRCLTAAITEAVFTVGLDVKYNGRRSDVTITGGWKDRILISLSFYLCGVALITCKEIKSPGHFITDELRTDRNINQKVQMRVVNCQLFFHWKNINLFTFVAVQSKKLAVHISWWPA